MESSDTKAQVVKISIRTDSRLADTLSDYLMGILDSAVEFGVDEHSSTTVVHGFVQLNQASVTDLEALDKQVADYAEEVAAIFQVPVPQVSCRVVADQDWARNWQEYFRAFEIVPGLVIAPSWEPYQVSAGERVIVMDPGMAFGTGHHATTRLCLGLIRSTLTEETGCTMLDVGTGTGILGMAAVLFGASEVVAIDNDSDAVAAAAGNIARNHLQDKIEVSAVPLEETVSTYRLVVANIVHDVLLGLADDLARVTEETGFLILSGLIYGAQTDNIAACFEKRGFSLVQKEREDEWGAMKFVKTGSLPQVD